MSGNQEELVEGHSRALPRWVYYVMIVAATVFWGGGFVAMKDIVEGMGPSTLVGGRFMLAAVLMLVFFGRRIVRAVNKPAVMAGLLLGVFYFMGFYTQTVGLTDTTPGKNAFLTASYVVMVPFVYWLVAKRRPTVVNVIAGVLCLVGIGLVSLSGGDGGGVRFGDAMTLVCAVFYALHIAFLGKYAQDADVFLLAFLQFAVCGVAGLIVGVLTEPLPEASFMARPDIMVQFLFAALCCSFLACLFQNVAQTKVPPSQASLIMSLESVFGVLFSVVFYGEVVSLRTGVGFVVIFAAILASELLANRGFKWLKKTT